MEINLKRYRELSIPVENFEMANEKLDAFYKEVQEARVKHGIPDVALGMSINYTLPDGSETTSLTTAHIGSLERAPVIAAYMHASAQADHQQNIDAIISKGGKRRRVN